MRRGVLSTVMATASLRRVASGVAARAPEPDRLARWSLGAMLLVAGVHKLVDPAAWTVYVVDWLEPFVVVSPRTFMLANGWFEVAFGLALLADRYTTLVAFVTAVSLSATVAYLGIVWVTTGQFGDVAARDVGLAGLAWVVTISALRKSSDNEPSVSRATAARPSRKK